MLKDDFCEDESLLEWIPHFLNTGVKDMLEGRRLQCGDILFPHTRGQLSCYVAFKNVSLTAVNKRMFPASNNLINFKTCPGLVL